MLRSTFLPPDCRFFDFASHLASCGLCSIVYQSFLRLILLKFLTLSEPFAVWFFFSHVPLFIFAFFFPHFPLSRCPLINVGLRTRVPQDQLLDLLVGYSLVLSFFFFLD